MRRKLLTLISVVALILYIGLNFLPERYAVNMPLSFLSNSALNTVDQLKAFTLPSGFHATVFAQDLNRVRFMRVTDQGDLLATLPKSGQVVLLKADRNGDGTSDGRKVLLADLKLPHGIDIFNGWLYIAETNAVGRIRFDSVTAEVVGEYHRIIDLPDSGNHWTRTLRFGPDGLMYVSIGSSCNVCIEDDQRRAAVLRFKPDGTEQEFFATGLRNSVGFDWSPVDGELYATENGRDLLGDNFPPDELNRIVKGGFYGWPFVHGNRVPDPDYGLVNEQEIERSITPMHEFRAHNAPLGIKFLQNDRLPSQYKQAALVALHGSWNRSTKDGYKVVSLHQRADGKFEEIDFMTGFEKNEQVIGRPVAVEESKDGEIYISDDFSATIYRITYDREK